MASRFEDTICGFTPLFRTLLYLNLALLGLLGVAFVFTSPHSPAYYISIITVGLLLLTSLSIVGVLRFCDRQTPG